MSRLKKYHFKEAGVSQEVWDSLDATSCFKCKEKCKPALRIIEHIDTGGNPWIYYRALDYLHTLCQGE